MVMNSNIAKVWVHSCSYYRGRRGHPLESDFLKIMGISPQKEPTGVILVSFDHLASSDFNVWLRSWGYVLWVLRETNKFVSNVF